MSLPLPRLDTHTFDQLVEEGSALLPRYAPEWTDYNWHDPGITLIDLFAWLVEMDMYQLDRTSQAAVRAFLRLVGIHPRPPAVAETVLVFNVNDPAKTAMLNPGVIVTSADGQTQFQTTRKLFVSNANLVSVLAGTETSLADCTLQNQTHKLRFMPFGNGPQLGQALYLGFDKLPGEVGDEISLYVWVNSTEDDLTQADRLREESDPDPITPVDCMRPVPCPRVDWRKHYSVRTQWEYFDETDWFPLAEVEDETRALTLSGAVRFKLPVKPQPKKDAVPMKPGQYFIRCRLVRGYFECPPEIQHIALNAVRTRNAIKAGIDEYESNGHAGQSFQLSKAPVVARTTRIRVTGDGKAWHEAPNWDRVGPHDHRFVLIPETGQILFGDGLHGRVPKDKAKIYFRYQQGGGPAGNVRAGTLGKVINNNAVKVEQRFDATGGADAETLTHAKARALAWMTDPHRAVTLKDFEQLTLTMPGVPVRRVHALADYDPALPGLPALGSVTVIVVSPCANPIPEPGPDLLQAIAQYLDRRRLITTELHVISPSFVTIAVRAALHADPQVDADKLPAEAESRLNIFLDPLRGGADGEGWPFGRAVYQSEIMALLNAIPGVDYVDEVGLILESGLDVYQGYVTWRQNFERGEATTTVQAQFRIEPHQVASRVTAAATKALQDYFDSPRGRSKHIPQKARREDVTAILSNVLGVFRVEEVKLKEDQTFDALCGNILVCPHSLIIPGQHQLTVNGANNCKPVRICKPPC